MQIAACQLDVAWEDKRTNFARIGALCDAADLHDGGLLLLPEMFATGFSMNVAGNAEGADRPAERFLAETARRHNCTVLGGVVNVGPDGRGRNEAVAFAPDGRELARYAKLHPFTFAGEAEHYSPGDRLVAFDCGGFRAAPLICYDLRFPEVFRVAALRGATLLAVVANWPQRRHRHWATLLRARAIENQACVVGVNRCGEDPNEAYAGGSLILDPRGDVLAAGGEEPGIVSAELDPEIVRAARRDFPALDDARSDFLADPREAEDPEA